MLDSQSHSISNTKSEPRGYKVCAIRECENVASVRLEIKFIHRYGWFCVVCAGELETADVILSKVTDTKR
jgi:hypothetical protein